MAKGEKIEDINTRGRNEGAVSGPALKKHVAAIMKQQAVLDDERARMRELYDAAERDGLSKPELKYIVKHKTKSLSEDFKDTVNIYMQLLGDLPLFRWLKDEEAA